MLIQILLVLLFWIKGDNSHSFVLVNSNFDTSKKIVNSSIDWSSNRRLTWDDFQKEVDVNDPLHALASTNIGVQATCKNNQMVFDVKCQFAINESWSKNKNSEELLQHEQLHFDLTEVYARLLRQKLSQQKSLCTGDKTRFKAVVNKVFADWQKAQQRYDTESKHGLDDIKQAYWTKTVASQLESLIAFASDATDKSTASF
ncbi:DUF922 domain-containing protein [Adhaeribacter radiodurans]|uniref:DUF922 domain-containing protein n=1 Tax=Adhaeribacter radiodurans TaxID=2745197 RepID=A0A7L7L7Z4_9BACT|nr:DUF922 domain-containing protein [Adhaeribacter radiodurans]QMU28499.1 DUF922 domain-containing protein [Adhaeribacter radiodurans]